MTHSALISVTHNISLATFAFAQRTIAIYAIMTLRALCRASLDRLIKRDKVMPWVVVASGLDTGGAVVPVRTVHAFMAYAVNVLDDILESCRKNAGFVDGIAYLIAAITNSKMAHIAARSAEIGRHSIKSRLFGRRFKSVAGMMPMF